MKPTVTGVVAVFGRLYHAKALYDWRVPIRVVNLQERPDLEGGFWSDEFARSWPAFMFHDPTASLYFGAEHFAHYRAFALVAFDEAAPDTVIARAASVPFAFGGPGRGALPAGGWDEVLRWAHRDRMLRTPLNAVSALEITLRPDRKGQALAGLMVRALRDNARAQGFDTLYAPVRPNQKHLEPLVPMWSYVARTQAEDGLPFDPWLRVHVRLGGQVLGVAPCSMTISAALQTWRSWTGLPFDTSGDVIVPGALVPVHVSVEQDHAVYVEPNVWVRHTL